MSMIFVSCDKEELNCDCGEIVTNNETDSFLIETSGALHWWYRSVDVRNYCTDNVVTMDSVCYVLWGDTTFLNNPEWEDYFDNRQVGDEWCNEKGVW